MLSDADTRLVASQREDPAGLDPEIPAKFRTFSQVYSASLAREIQRHSRRILRNHRAAARNGSVFGVMPIQSAAAREIGVRVALGAGSGDVLRMILGQDCGLFSWSGDWIAGSLALTRTVESLLFGVTATDR